MIGLLKKKYRSARRGILHYRNSLLDSSPKLLILLYHRVLPKVVFNPFNTIVSLDTFIRHIDFLSQRYSIISMKDAIEQSVSGDIKNKKQVVLTFDDGYVDNYKTVCPILRKKNIPAVFFLTTGYVGKGSLRDWKEICDKNGLECDYETDRCINWEEARNMSDNGMEIGSHAVSHNSLTSLSLEEAGQEIVAGKQEIEKKTGKPCVHFAFPFGSAKDYNKNLIECVRKADFKSCLLNIHGYNNLNSGIFCFKRIIMDENINLRHLLG